MDKPGLLWSIFSMRCPRCRRGRMFENNNPWNLRKVLHMKKQCPECNQHYELEPGFWYGTGYVSYALSVLYIIITFVLWWIFIGFSVSDNRFFWWMGITIGTLVILQPWLMRLSRALYLYFFIKYNPDYKNSPVVKFDNS
ncbi:MAG: DUF983 domain-containing protein [Chitinophagaceae bacterium]|nr:DUF983 domain-containing protein [Chitinophagaceae bacterium]